MDFCHASLTFTSSCIMFHVKFQTFTFSEVAPIVIEGTICFLIYRHIDVSKFEAYRAINSILNDNICNFINRYGISFDQHYKNVLQLVWARMMNDYFFMFAINKTVAFDHHGILKTDLERIQSYNYILKLSSAPIYSYTQPWYSRETINLNEYTLLLSETRDKSRRRKTNIFRNLIRTFT